MRVHVALLAAWCLAPLNDVAWITDPDIDDDPQRYDGPPKGGWSSIAAAVMSVYSAIQTADLDVLQPSFEVDIDARLTLSQESIVYGWFFQGEAPQWSPEEGSWLNGRHRTWGLKAAGFAYAPCLLISLGDAIQRWDDDEWGPLDHEAIEGQKADLNWWSTAPAAVPWRVANDAVAPRWRDLIERWENRLDSS